MMVGTLRNVRRTHPRVKPALSGQWAVEPDLRPRQTLASQHGEEGHGRKRDLRTGGGGEEEMSEKTSGGNKYVSLRYSGISKKTMYQRAELRHYVQGWKRQC
ncbi:hypothetical protein RRG08_024624 [Elysia crispata]|uniref:Uncharacterized protein n=1 Tax=Elysia crispata TaxID=231223 RepID=A0AAE1DNX7_9GAST|nr:hypothetical protein RRG08_024624 [Elysia crispata]